MVYYYTMSLQVCQNDFVPVTELSLGLHKAELWLLPAPLT